MSFLVVSVNICFERYASASGSRIVEIPVQSLGGNVFGRLLETEHMKDHTKL